MKRDNASHLQNKDKDPKRVCHLHIGGAVMSRIYGNPGSVHNPHITIYQADFFCGFTPYTV